MDPEEFERRMEAGYRLEQGLQWPEAERHYGDLSREPSLTPGQIADARARHANVLMELRRWDEARREFDEALDAAKRSGDDLVLARTLVGAGAFAATRNDVERAENFLLTALDLFHQVHDREGLAGEGWTLVNLAAIYGRTRRLDLAFLTFEKARERLFQVEDWIGVATAWELQAQLRDVLGDADRRDDDYHEAMSFYAKQGMTAKVEEIRQKLRGKRVV